MEQDRPHHDRPPPVSPNNIPPASESYCAFSPARKNSARFSKMFFFLIFHFFPKSYVSVKLLISKLRKSESVWRREASRGWRTELKPVKSLSSLVKVTNQTSLMYEIHPALRNRSVPLTLHQSNLLWEFIIKKTQRRVNVCFIVVWNFGGKSPVKGLGVAGKILWQWMEMWTGLNGVRIGPNWWTFKLHEGCWFLNQISDCKVFVS